MIVSCSSVPRVGSATQYVAVDGGFCEVRPESVTVLAESAEKPEQIDTERAERARQRSQEQLTKIETSGSGEEIERARGELARAKTRLEVASKSQ